MIRVLLIFLVIALAAAGAAWLADNPGEVTIVWLERETRISIGVALAGALLLAIGFGALWSLLRFALRIPRLLHAGSRARRQEKGFAALSRGLVAVGSGDAIGARRHALETRKFIGGHPLSLLLDAQSAQLSGDREEARRAFRAMTQTPPARLLGWRGLFVEAQRAGDEEAARIAAGEAVALAPSAAWANEAALADRFAARDWQGARVALERAERLRVLDKPTSKRHRAVLLAAEAQDAASRDAARALSLAREAADLAPTLVPAVTLAARLLGERGDLKKALRLVEAAWKLSPHPDLAQIYVNLRPGDSALDRLQRAQTLAKLAPGDAESAYAVAHAALDAREFATARSALAPLLAVRSSVRACLLAADLAELDEADQGATRYWLARAARAPRDRAWVADGVVSDAWSPISPATGRLDAFVWAWPPERLSHEADPERPPTIDASATPEGADEPVIAPAEEAQPPEPPKPMEAAASSVGMAPPAARATPVIFPVVHAPDDPGATAEPLPRRWRVFNG